MELENTGRERVASSGYREGEGWKWRIQGGRELEVEDTGRKRDGSRGYREGEGWK